MINQQQLLKFITRINWVFFILAGIISFMLASPKFTLGILFGGLIVTVNFHLLARTLVRALTPPHLSSRKNVLVKYYIRFIASGIIIFVLISGHFVNPLGLFIGLSVVVASIITATMNELTKIIFKEAV